MISASNQKDCSLLKDWSHSVTNHMYWCAMSTVQNQGELVLAKWLSVVNHAQNIHTGHGPMFPKCVHGVLSRRETKKKWLKPSIRAATKLEALVTNKVLCRDIKKLSGGYQTSAVEAFHSLLIHFAPKMMAFSYHGMKCRNLLAAMHYNENAQREQAVTKDGKARHSVHFPKYKKGGYIVRKLVNKTTYGYVDSLMEQVVCECFSTRVTRKPPNTIRCTSTPNFVASAYTRPEKAAAVQEHLSRFSKS